MKYCSWFECYCDLQVNAAPILKIDGDTSFIVEIFRHPSKAKRGSIHHTPQYTVFALMQSKNNIFFHSPGRMLDKNFIIRDILSMAVYFNAQ